MTDNNDAVARSWAPASVSREAALEFAETVATRLAINKGLAVSEWAAAPSGDAPNQDDD